MPRTLVRSIARSTERLYNWPQTRAVVARPDGSAYEAGETFRQPDLANTLALIARAGPAGFYRGTIAVALAHEMRRHPGPNHQIGQAAGRGRDVSLGSV